MRNYITPEVQSLTTDRVVELMGPVSCGSSQFNSPLGNDVDKAARPGGTFSAAQR